MATQKTLTVSDYLELCRRHPVFFPDDTPGAEPWAGYGNKVVLTEREDLAGANGGYVPIPRCTACGHNHWAKCTKTN